MVSPKKTRRYSVVFGSRKHLYPPDSKIPVDISLILGNLITVIVDYQIPHKPLKILSL